MKTHYLKNLRQQSNKKLHVHNILRNQVITMQKKQDWVRTRNRKMRKTIERKTKKQRNLNHCGKNTTILIDILIT